MARLTAFFNYAVRFEQAYASDDWSAIAPAFTEDGSYVVVGPAPFAGRHEGRPALLAYFAAVTRGFDRRFAAREVAALEGPEERGDHVYMRWAAVYSVPDAPPLRLEGESRAFYEGERMLRLEDRIPERFGAAVLEWMQAHGARLAPAAEAAA